MIQAFDWSVLNIIQLMRNPTLDWIFPKITILGEAGAVWIVIAVLMLMFRKTRKCGIALSVALVFCLICGNVILKPLVARQRPYMIDESIKIITYISDDFSFPSGHTYSSIASAIVIWRFMKRKFGVPAMVLALTITFSRLYLQMHFPTDVLGGVILGMLAALCGIKTADMIYKSNKES